MTTTPTKRERPPPFWQCIHCYAVNEGRRSKLKVCRMCGAPSLPKR